MPSKGRWLPNAATSGPLRSSRACRVTATARVRDRGVRVTDPAFWAPLRSPMYRQPHDGRVSKPGRDQHTQLKAILEAADRADSDSVLLRTLKGGTDPALVEVWLFSEEAEGIVGMIEVDPAGVVAEIDE